MPAHRENYVVGIQRFLILLLTLWTTHGLHYDNTGSKHLQEIFEKMLWLIWEEEMCEVRTYGPRQLLLSDIRGWSPFTWTQTSIRQAHKTFFHCSALIYAETRMTHSIAFWHNDNSDITSLHWEKGQPPTPLLPAIQTDKVAFAVSYYKIYK